MLPTTRLTVAEVLLPLDWWKKWNHWLWELGTLGTWKEARMVPGPQMGPRCSQSGSGREEWTSGSPVCWEKLVCICVCVCTCSSTCWRWDFPEASWKICWKHQPLERARRQHSVASSVKLHNMKMHFKFPRAFIAQFISPQKPKNSGNLPSPF